MKIGNNQKLLEEKLEQKVNEINYLQPIIMKSEINLENNINFVTGSSLGGSVCDCTYLLFNFVYASKYSIENKNISDPFPYKKLRKINFFITDNKI